VGSVASLAGLVQSKLVEFPLDFFLLYRCTSGGSRMAGSPVASCPGRCAPV